jgi:hypothetical protein
VTDPRTAFRLQLIEELVELRMDGFEPPLDGPVVLAAADRVAIRRALELARRDRRWLLVRLLAWYLPTIRP